MQLGPNLTSYTKINPKPGHTWQRRNHVYATFGAGGGGGGRGALQFSAELLGGLLPDVKCKKKSDPITPGITAKGLRQMPCRLTLTPTPPTTFLCLNTSFPSS